MQLTAEKVFTNTPNAAFAASLLDPTSNIPSGVTAVKGKGAKKRFNVYRNNVTHGLIEALEAIFPAVSHFISKESFTRMAILYLRSYPPKSPLLFEYGYNFAHFIDHLPQTERYLPWLGDLARVERLWLSSYHARNAEPIKGEALENMDPRDIENIRFKTHPALNMFSSSFAVYDLFVAGRSKKTISFNVESPQNILITRAKENIEVRLLSKDNFIFFAALGQGKTLKEACAIAVEEDPQFDLARALKYLLISGAFTQIFV